MAIEIYAFPPSPRSFKVLLAAELAEVVYELRYVNLGAGEQRSAAITGLNVNQRMPVLVDGDYVLWESNAIIEYLASQASVAELMPRLTPERLQIGKWLYWEAAHWDPAIVPFMFENVVKPLFGLGAPDETVLAKAEPPFARLAGVLDAILADQPYVAGDHLTLADVALCAPLCHAEQARLPLVGYGSIQRWSDRIKQLSAWQRASARQRVSAAGTSAAVTDAEPVT